MKSNVKQIIGALMWVWVMAFLVLAFFSPWAAKLASAANGSYQCTAYSSVTTMPLMTGYGMGGAWIPGIGGSGALANCHAFTTDTEFNPGGIQGTSVACVLNTFSNLSGGSYETGTAHAGANMTIQIEVFEDTFFIECNFVYSDY